MARRQQSTGASKPPAHAWGGAYPPQGGPDPHKGDAAALKAAGGVRPLVDPHSIESCENLLENYFMQARRP